MVGGAPRNPKYEIPETIATPSDGAIFPAKRSLAMVAPALNTAGITTDIPNPIANHANI